MKNRMKIVVRSLWIALVAYVLTVITVGLGRSYFQQWKVRHDAAL